MFSVIRIKKRRRNAKKSKITDNSAELEDVKLPVDQTVTSDNVVWFVEKKKKPSVTTKTIKKIYKCNREINKTNRMLGKEYVGFERVDNKNCRKPRPGRVMGPVCGSAFCARSKVMSCSALTHETRQRIFDKFWSMSWTEKQTYVSSMVDRRDIKRVIKSKRSKSHVFSFLVEDEKKRVCMSTFVNTLGIKVATVRYWLGYD